MRFFDNLRCDRLLGTIRSLAICLFKDAKLTGEQIEDLLPTIQMPEVKVSSGRSVNTAAAQISSREAMPRAIIEIAGIADVLGSVPIKANGTCLVRGQYFNLEYSLVQFALEIIALN